MRPNSRLLFSGLLLGMLGLLWGFAGPLRPLPDPLAGGPAEQQWVDSVFNALTPEQRLGQFFMVAAYSNRPVPSLQVLQDHGGDLRVTTREGWTPLHLLLTHGDFPEAVALLLQQGADPHQHTHPCPPDTPGMSALRLARLYKRTGSLACMEG